MKKNLAIFLITLITFSNFAQNSDKAKKYLDDVATKVSSYENISIDFKYSLKNEAENIEQSTSGNVYLKGDLYKFSLMGVTRLCDGKKTYLINPEDEEITISKITDENNEEGAITPSKMLTFYKDGYRYAWDKKLPIKGRTVQYIKLTPIDSNSELKYVLLGIDTDTKNIYNVIENGKNGAITTFTVNSFKTNQPLSESLFIFDKNKYSDYYINE